jgi:beta-lactamase superfamily II metal-dependent hydrolase
MKQVGVFIQRQELLAILSPFRAAHQNEMTRTETTAGEASTDTSSSTSPSFAISQNDAFCKVTIFPGNSQLIRLPNSVAGLIDCGRHSVRWIVEALANHRIRSLHFIAVTHWDRDHFDGVSAILDIIDKVHTFWIPYNPLLLHRDTRPTELLDSLRAMRGGKVGSVAELGEATTLASLRSPEGSLVATIDALNPAFHASGYAMQQGLLTPNDACAVYRVGVGITTCLLTGDASINAWETLIAAQDRTSSQLAADLLLVPHHGSRSSLNANIASRLLKPAGSIAVFEPLARYGLPHQDVLHLLESLNAEVLSAQDQPLHFVLFEDGLYAKPG